MRNNNGKRLPVAYKILIIFGIITIMFTSAFLLKDTVVFGSYRIFLRKIGNFIINDKQRHEQSDGRTVESDNFDSIDNDIPFRVQRPSWLPEGYELEYADYTKHDNDNYIIEYEYRNDESDYIKFSINTENMSTHKNNFTAEPDEIDIGEIRVLYVAEDEYSFIEYNNRQGHRIGINANSMFTKEDIVKIIESME